MNVRQFLDERHVPFEILEHAPTYSAQRMAHALHVRGEEVAKSVVLRADGRYVLALVPASCHVDMEKARRALQTDTCDLAEEGMLERLFPDCERGAMPPFGSQYGLMSMVDEALTRDERLVFEGNTHNEAIRMPYREFARLEHPRVAAIAARG